MITAGTKLGRYEIRSPLGAGGMGEVYLAQDTQLERTVALKVLLADVASDKHRMSRFTQEAKAASALNHPNILTIHEVGEDAGINFIATEFIEGETLRQRMKGARMKMSEMLNVTIQVADALSAAHEAGIIHRDIKPENIMLRRRDGYVKVLDFGLAKLIDVPTFAVDTEAATKSMFQTDAGVVMGTALYMSPEQARGSKVDARTDIWSLGAVLYEMVAGCLPFDGSTTSEILAAIINEKEPPPLARFAREVPAELERIVEKAIRKDREERYQTAKDLLLDLRRLKHKLEVDAEIERTVPPEKFGVPPSGGQLSEAKTSPPEGGTPNAPRTSSAEYFVTEIKRRKRGVAIALGIFILVGASVGYWLYKFIGQRHPPPAQAMKITRLTSTGRVTNSAISPDGKYVVYSMEEGDQESLWLSQVAMSSNAQIVPPAEVVYPGITFSRDGNSIYYVRNDKENPSGALYQAPVLGGSARKLLVNISSPITSSPDGKQLAFVRGSLFGKEESALMIVNADGTEEKKLAAHNFPDRFLTSGPDWSPDGKIIACGLWNRKGGVYRVVVGVRVADGAEQPITSQRWRGLSNPRIVWLSDNSGVLSTGAEQGGNPAQIWHLPWPKGEARSLTNDLNGFSELTLTADSGTIAAVRSDRVVNLWIAPNGATSRAKQITYGAERFDGARGLSWTPDGKIVFFSDAGGNNNVWIMAADGGGSKQLSANAPLNIEPTVTPDGHHIVWVSRPTGNTNIWRMEIDGSGPKQLTNGVAERGPQVSPDGKWIVYWTVDFSLWKVSIDGGNPAQMSDKAAIPVISPDGKQIACNYLDEVSGQFKIAVIPFAGGPPTRLFDILAGFPRSLQWTPDGDAIAFILTTKGVSNIWAQPLDGGPPKQLTDFKDQRIFNFAWSLDGKQLALSRGVINGDVVLITGFKQP